MLVFISRLLKPDFTQSSREKIACQTEASNDRHHQDVLLEESTFTQMRKSMVFQPRLNFCFLKNDKALT